jgi:hypothetical protein
MATELSTNRIPDDVAERAKTMLFVLSLGAAAVIASLVALTFLWHWYAAAHGL